MAKKVTSLIAFVIAFFAARYGMEAYDRHQAGGVAQDALERLKNDAVRNHPGVTVSLAMQQEGIEKGTAILASVKDDKARAQKAADMFWGYYFLNARARPEYCREQGVDIQRFVNAFEHVHTNEVREARLVYARSAGDENEMYSLLHAALQKAVVQDMSDVISTRNISASEACTLFSENADVVAQKLYESQSQSAVAQALALFK